MDDLFQVLIFVVTFIIFIVSAVRKQKKKAGKKVSGIEGLLESFLGQQEKPAHTPEEVRFEYPVQEEIITNTAKVTKPLREEGIDAIPDKKIKDDVYDIVDEEIEESEFDLQSAVIYSEILNRKSY